MAKKRPPLSSSSPISHLLWIARRLLISFSIILCLLALLRLHNSYYSKNHLSSAISMPQTSYSLHNTNTNISSNNNIHFKGPPKVAFLFMARLNLPLDFLWETFFKNGDVANFTIYIHSEPGFMFDESTTRSAFFYGRQLRKSIQVAWGEASMIEAERLLLEAALDDPANQRFVLLSDSCVPLYNFSYIYNYLMTSPRSFVDSFLDAKGGHYNPKMSHVIPKEKWRKGSQWITLVRRHAEVVVNDNIIFPVFKEFCKRWLPAELDLLKRLYNLVWIPQKRPNCIPDEHYVQTLLAIKGLKDEIEQRTLTYTFWNHSSGKKGRKAWHPVTFKYANASLQEIKKIKDINHVYYESEYRVEWCRTNSTFTPCFLFARKFSRGAAKRLLKEGVVGALSP